MTGARRVAIALTLLTTLLPAWALGADDPAPGSTICTQLAGPAEGVRGVSGTIPCPRLKMWGTPFTPARMAPTCRGHAERLQKERNGDLKELLDEVEKEMVMFLSRHDQARAQFKSLPEKVHHTVEAIAPYLFENIACSRCKRLMLR